MPAEVAFRHLSWSAVSPYPSSAVPGYYRTPPPAIQGYRPDQLSWSGVLSSAARQVTTVLNKRQARWAEGLAEYSFVIHYRRGSTNTKADLLSRRADYIPTEEDAVEYEQPDGADSLLNFYRTVTCYVDPIDQGHRYKMVGNIAT